MLIHNQVPRYNVPHDPPSDHAIPPYPPPPEKSLEYIQRVMDFFGLTRLVEINDSRLFLKTSYRSYQISAAMSRGRYGFFWFIVFYYRKFYIQEITSNILSQEERSFTPQKRRTGQR
jgi:hypothetical protein